MSLFSRRQFLFATLGAVFSGPTVAKSISSLFIHNNKKNTTPVSNQNVPVIATNLAHPPPYTPSLGLNKDRALLLCGGGDYMLAWTLGYFYALHQSGVDLGKAEVIVGTSAGAIAGSAIATGHFVHLLKEVNFFTDMPQILMALTSTKNLNTSQKRALQQCLSVKDAKPLSLQAIGRAAMATHVSLPEDYEASLKRLLGLKNWPSDKLFVTTTDTYTGERLVISNADNVPIEQACTASNAWPGLKSPVWIGEYSCMDGGVSETSTHADILAGAKRVMIFSLTDGSPQSNEQGLRLSSLPNTLNEDIASLAKVGSQTLLITAGLPPGKKTVDLLDPKLIGQGLTYGYVRGIAGADQVKQFWV